MPESEAPPETTGRDTAQAPRTDAEVGSLFMRTLFAPPSETDTETEVSEETESEAGVSAEEEVEPEIEAEAAEITEESEETQEEETVESPQPRKLRIPKDDGSHEEVDEEEAVKSYLRHSDYTRKVQSLADERKKFEVEEVARVREERQRLAALLPAVEEILKPQTPDWEAIQRERPDEFPALFAQHQLAEKQFEAVRAKRVEVEAQAQRDHAEQRMKLMEAERSKLYEKVPELKEETTAKALGSYLKGLGFTEEEIVGTTRHELLVMARKAQLYDEAQKVKPKIEQKVEQKIKPAKPGAASSTKPKVTELDRSVKRLKETGSVDALANVLNRVLK